MLKRGHRDCPHPQNVLQCQQLPTVVKTGVKQESGPEAREMWKCSICRTDNETYGKRKPKVGTFFHVVILPPADVGAPAMACRLAGRCYNLILGERK